MGDGRQQRLPFQVQVLGKAVGSRELGCAHLQQRGALFHRIVTAIHREVVRPLLLRREVTRDLRDRQHLLSRTQPVVLVQFEFLFLYHDRLLGLGAGGEQSLAPRGLPDVDFPGGGVGVLGRVAPPRRLDERGCRRDLPVEVLLPLLLLDLQGKTRAENPRREREEGDGEDGEAGGDGLPHPRLGHLVPVADGGDGDHPPPQGIRVAAELHLAGLIDSVLLGQVHEVGGEDEAQEADVQRGDQLLAVDEDHGAQQPPGAPLAVDVQHPQDLEEADAPDG